MTLLAPVVSLSLLLSAPPASAGAEAPVKNPLLAPWTGPYAGVPPFDQVKVAQFAPALEAAMAETLAPSFGLDAFAADRASAQVERALGLPVIDRARHASRAWRELSLWFPDGPHLVEGIVDLVFEEDGQLVVVDYKSDAIADDQALAQAAHHAPQLQLYGRGLAQAAGLPVRERLVLFTALGRAVPV